MISCVSDIHLDFKFEKSKSKYYVEVPIKDTIKRILSNSTRILLIGGDVSANFDIYKLFVIELSKEARKKNVKVIFILGNHELWYDYNYFYFKDYKLEEIINEYKELIISNNMYFVQNNLLFFENENINSISEEEINTVSQKQIRDKLRKSNLIIFGGLGYSGFNVEFNANNGIYRNTINLEKDIEETKKFLDIYNKIKDYIYDRNVIVLTHTPKKNWSESE